MGRLAKPASAGSGVTTDVATVTGAGRLPSDLADELLDVLAEEPRIVVCDLHGMAAGPAAEVFAPVAGYLQHWPGTVVVVCVADPEVKAGVLSTPVAGRLLVERSPQTGIDHARRRAPHVRRAVQQLPPLATASRDARRFVTRTLLDWQSPRLVGAATLVASELVTNSVLHAATILDVNVSQVDVLLRLAVRDRGGGRPVPRSAAAPGAHLGGRGLMIVQALTRAWDVLPARTAGKTVWAVIDETSGRGRKTSA